MTVLITGSAGHLGEALVRWFRGRGVATRGVDIAPSPFTDCVGTIADAEFVRDCMDGIDGVLHAATLHKPHVVTHSKRQFVDTNISGTLNLLEAAQQAGSRAFIYTSTTSTFGDAMRSGTGEPAVWVTERLSPQPKNIYGATKLAAEHLCQLFSRNHQLPCLVLRTSRFFPEDDDNRRQRTEFSSDNLKVNELLYRRVDVEDICVAHELALQQAGVLGFDRFIISATTPLQPAHAAAAGQELQSLVGELEPRFAQCYAARDWRLPTRLDRVYDNTHARNRLGWQPKYSFGSAVAALLDGASYQSQLAVEIGSKGYHEKTFTDGPYPVAESD